MQVKMVNSVNSKSDNFLKSTITRSGSIITSALIIHTKWDLIGQMSVTTDRRVTYLVRGRVGGLRGNWHIRPTYISMAVKGMVFRKFHSDQGA